MQNINEFQTAELDSTGQEELKAFRKVLPPPIEFQIEEAFERLRHIPWENVAQYAVVYDDVYADSVKVTKAKLSFILDSCGGSSKYPPNHTVCHTDKRTKTRIWLEYENVWSTLALFCRNIGKPRRSLIEAYEDGPVRMSLENAAKCGIDLTQVLAALHTFNKAVISHLGNMLKDQEENLIGLLRAVAAARGIPTSQLIAERHGVARVCAQTYDHDPDYEDEL